MEVKLEEKLEIAPYTSVCSTCLSTDRKTHAVEPVSYAYGLMTDWAPQDGARVCWECRAILARMLRFKLQALRAKEFLEAANVPVIGTDLLTGKCLSNLIVKPVCNFTAGNLPTTAALIDPAELEVKPLIEIDSDDEDVWAEDAKPIEIEIPGIKEETKGRPKRKIVRQVKFQVKTKKLTKKPTKKPVKDALKSKSKSSEDKGRELRPRPKKSRRRNDEIIEVFTVTMAQLIAYKDMANANLERAMFFTCKPCMDGFKTEENLKKHNHKFHSEEAGKFACDICTSRFKTMDLMTQHWNKHFQMYRCRYPGCQHVQHKRRMVHQHYANHMIKQHAAERLQGQYQGDIFECDHCHKVFTSRKLLVFHMKTHSKNFMCEQCSYKCSNASQLRIHMMAHLGPSHRPHECERCHKRFTTKQKLIYHVRSHTGERPYQCETCGKKFVGKEALTRHIKLRHFKIKSEKNPHSQPRTKPAYINSRPIYNYNNYVNKDGVKRDPITNKFECHICKKQTNQYANLQAHYICHAESIHKCKDCNKTFKDPSRLEKHIRGVHKGIRPFKCEVCGAGYTTKVTLETHMASHSDERPHKCDECNATFKYKGNLTAHKLIHTGEKPHQCNICGSSFTLKGNLSGHMKIHTNERPYECNICGKKFPWNRNLKNHLKTHVK